MCLPNRCLAIHVTIWRAATSVTLSPLSFQIPALIHVVSFISFLVHLSLCFSLPRVSFLGKKKLVKSSRINFLFVSLYHSLIPITYCCWNRYSDWLRAARLRGRSSIPGWVKNFLFSTSSRPDLGLSPGVKRPGREADHLPPASTEVKKMWIYTSTPPYAFMA
jgi:hypothetical protein